MAVPRNKRTKFRTTQNKKPKLPPKIDPVTGLPYEIDPVTGKPYRVLPSLRKDGFDYSSTDKGDYRTQLHAVDLDLNNLNDGASTYLPGRLRQPPNKEEIRKLIAERKRRELERESIYKQETTPLEERLKATEEKTRERVTKKMQRNLKNG